MDFVIELIVNFALQMLFTLGFIFLFGKVIALCNARFYKNFGSRGHVVCIATGFIGTPVHEASHALMCLIFGHKITEIKFFQPNSSDGTLGYVSHSYNPKNLYQKVGNLFIGIAPILIGFLILGGLLYLLLPEMFGDVLHELDQVDFISDFGQSFVYIGKAFVDMFSYIGNWQWWVFLLVGSFIGLHMTLSKADMQGALSGIIVFLLLFLIVDLVLLLIKKSLLVSFTNAILTFGTFLLFFFCLFFLIAVVLLIISAIIGKVTRDRY